MLGRLPPLYPLRAFEATARTGSVTAAARELNITHSAVSHQLRSLENYLQVQLFRRSGRGLLLTSEGAALLPEVTFAFEKIISAAAGLERPVMTGELRIGCVPGILNYWLMPRLDDFARTYPELRLRIDAATGPEAIYRSTLDVAILYGDGAWTDLWVKRWNDVYLFPVASPILLNSKPLRSLRDLSKHRLLFAGDHREWQSWLSDADGLSLMKCQKITMSDAYLTTQAAVLGQGVALGDTITSEPLLENGSLIAPFSRKVSGTQRMYVVCRMGGMEDRTVRAFIDWVFASRAGRAVVS
ncbi:LysR substrate-binding domain-containing protein [uncultured Nitratireductor sp.]|uniref:LysR substrate-binding domain-containing protein n=1 Tax=uncultured Nitratireductor sp. TaxID=520953 RepID=UPI0025FDFBEF|nr:LysR substrate-binding domain-containing protein [uncultured Nitratireductor sp.]